MLPAILLRAGGLDSPLFDPINHPDDLFILLSILFVPFLLSALAMYASTLFRSTLRAAVYSLCGFAVIGITFGMVMNWAGNYEAPPPLAPPAADVWRRTIWHFSLAGCLFLLAFLARLGFRTFRYGDSEAQLRWLKTVELWLFIGAVAAVSVIAGIARAFL
jgi:hypothetical protein